MWRPHTFENVGFQRSSVGQDTYKFNPNTCLALRRLVTKVGSLFSRYDCLFSTPTQDAYMARFKTSPLF